MKFELTILGSNSAIPTYDRFPTSQVLNVNECLYLIDCGEGTQIQLSKYKIRRSKIKQIFISHHHGDHIYGLFGLLTSYNHFGREDKLQIFTPAGLEEVIYQILDLSNTELAYQLECITVDTTKFQQIFDDENIEVFSIPLKHRIPTSGYLFKEKKPERNLDPSKIDQYNLSFEQMARLKRGKNISLESGETLHPDHVCLPARKPRSYAFCSDTIYDESIIPWITGVDLLYHETTYMEDMATQARDRMHATAKEAALIAKKARVGKLITGHYSSRYKTLEGILNEARSIFPDTVLGIEGRQFSIQPRTAKNELK